MKTIYKYLALAAVMVSFSACKKELGALPKNSKVDEITIVDQGTAQIALNGAYYTFANATQTKTGWQMHQIIPASLAGYLGYGFGTQSYEENMNSGLDTFWPESYVLLNTTNGVLKGVTGLADNKFSGNRKKEMLGEAHFLRAYAHFKLLSYYAEWYKPNSTLGVLLRDELSTLSNINKARSTVAESYSFILADLDDAIANAPAANPKYYATKWAAMALKMRVLMSRGAPADYTEIISLADSVINNSSYVLEANVEDIFHTKGLSSTEVILGLQPQALQVADPYSKSKQYWPGASSLYVAKDALKTLYANDPRLAWMIGSSNPSASAPDTYYFSKFYRENTAPSVVSETDYAIRLTEVYLLKAEAIVRSGGNLADAKALVHTIQSKAGITATVNNTNYLAVENAGTPAVLLVEIYKETVRSLVAEDGMEWMALLRLPFATVQQIKPTITSQIQYILPVPADEFKYNPSFGDQNPGYAKN
jgi:hypothetical protein